MLMTCPKCGKLVQGKEGDQCSECKIFLRPPNRIQARDEDDSPATPSPRTAERLVLAKIAKAGESGTGGRWIAFLRGLLWISFSLICFVALFYSFRSFTSAIWYVSNGLGEYAGHIFLYGIIILLGGILVAFIALAAGMVTLDVAENIRRSANNTSRILEILGQQEKH